MNSIRPTQAPLSELIAIIARPLRRRHIERIEQYESESIAPRTRAAYRAHWAAFAAWCEEQSRPSLPAAPDTVVDYLRAREAAGRKVATIGLDLAAIVHAHELAKLAAEATLRDHPELEGVDVVSHRLLTSSANAPSLRDNILVKKALKGIRRRLGIAQTQKAPLLGAELQRIAAKLPDTLIGARDRALLLVGFAGAFRSSELVALDVADLLFESDGLTVTLRRSKTDQEGAGRKVGLPYSAKAETCPVRAMQTWLDRAGLSSGAVFRSVNKGSQLGARLSRRDVWVAVKRRAAAAGLDPAAYGSHSLRAGLATSAAKAGRPAHAIMKQTGHRSIAMVTRYIRDVELYKDNAAAGLL